MCLRRRKRPSNHQSSRQSNRLVALGGGGGGIVAGSSGTQRSPERTARVMTPDIRTEFLGAVHRAFGALDYGVIGAGALAEYGNRRGTTDLDVMVPQEISEVVEEQLLSKGLVRTAGGGIGYVASDGQCYGLDITTDRAIGQTFKGRKETQRAPATAGTTVTHARLMTIGFLLNSKAYSYMTRVGPDTLAKKANDANDILFILNYMGKNGIFTNRQECRWVVDYDFWTTFTNNYEGTETMFKALGLQRDASPSNSNREKRSSSSLSRRSSGNGSHHPQHQGGISVDEISRIN